MLSIEARGTAFHHWKISVDGERLCCGNSYVVNNKIIIVSTLVALDIFFRADGLKRLVFLDIQLKLR